MCCVLTVWFHTSIPQLSDRTLDFLYEARDLLDDKFSKEEYDGNTWSTRVWFSFVVQQLAVAFHNAVAQEVLDEVCTATASAVPVSPTW